MHAEPLLEEQVEGDPLRQLHGWFRAAAELCAASGRLGDYDRLERVLDEALSVDTDPSLRSAQIAACCPGASQLLQAGRVAAADRMLSRLVAIAAFAPLDALASARLNQLRGFHALRAGNPAHARQAYRAASRFRRPRRRAAALRCA